MGGMIATAKVRGGRAVFAAGPPLLAATLGGLGSRNAPSAYRKMRKPSWAPPASVFGPVWTALYAGIGVAGWHLYPRADRTTQALHLTQLSVNTAWPVVFFSGRSKPASVAVITVLDSVLAVEVLRLRRSDPTAAVLLVPYLGWSLFATALNLAASAPHQR